jgi:hypothetical protein
LRVKELEFWTKVRARQEAYEEAVKIRKTRQRIAAAIMPPPGSPPFAYRPVFEAEGRRRMSRAEAEEARRWLLHRVAIHKMDAPYASREEYAVGIYALEMRDGKRKVFTRSRAAMPLAGSGTVAGDTGVAAGIGPWRSGAPPLTRDELERGFGVLSPDDAIQFHLKGDQGDGDLFLSRANVDLLLRILANDLSQLTADRDLFARILAKSPGRKRGRPPTGERAMTNTERSRKHRAGEKVT